MPQEIENENERMGKRCEFGTIFLTYSRGGGGRREGNGTLKNLKEGGGGRKGEIERRRPCIN